MLHSIMHFCVEKNSSGARFLLRWGKGWLNIFDTTVCSAQVKQNVVRDVLRFPKMTVLFSFPRMLSGPYRTSYLKADDIEAIIPLTMHGTSEPQRVRWA